MKRARVLLAIVAAGSAVAMTGRAAPSAPSLPTDPALALAALDRRIADLDAEEQSDKLEIARLGGEVGRYRAQVTSRARSFYKLTRAGLLPVGGGFGSLVTHAMHVERSRRQLIAELEEETHARARAGDLGARPRARRPRSRRAGQPAHLHGRGPSRHGRRAAPAGGLRPRVRDLDRGQRGYVAVYGGTGAAAESPAGVFAAARGKLLFPIAGRAEVRPAHREGTDGPGLEIHATVGHGRARRLRRTRRVRGPLRRRTDAS